MKSSIFRQAGRALSCLGGALFCAQIALAQPTEADEPIENAGLDDFIVRSTVNEKTVLAYQPIREADVMWERRIWRVVDVREKMNLPFVFPQEPLFNIFRGAIESGELEVYSAENDRFSKSLTRDEVGGMLFRVDSIVRFDPETYVEERVAVKSEINWEDVHRFRIKEAWFFDKNTGTVNVRILGIAPLLAETDAEGNFKWEKPLFWVHFPSARPVLARHKVYLPGDNMASTMTWDDLFEMRYFASTIYKENNVRDRRLEDYLTGTDLLMEADKIKNEIFNFEHDLWQQ